MLGIISGNDKRGTGTPLATPFEAQAQAGHSKPVMTSAYTLVGLDRREKAVRKVQLRLLKKTG